MSTAILVDTDVMVDYLRGHHHAVIFLKEQAGRIILSTIVVAELYAGVKGDAEQATLDDVVSLFRVVPVTADIAKALMDCGCHPPTVYFPLIVHEAIMVEPTETESKETLDAFTDAMIAIAARRVRLEDATLYDATGEPVSERRWRSHDSCTASSASLTEPSIR